MTTAKAASKAKATANPKGTSAVERLQARTAPIAVQNGGEVDIPLDKIRFDSTQPRQAFHHPDGQVSKEDELGLQALAETIEKEGLLQAIMVEAIGDGTYKVLVGERRTRAHLLLGRPTIRATIRNDLAATKQRRLIVQLVENVVREDISDVDMAKSIRSLLEGTADEPPMNQSQVAAGLGKSEGWVSRYVRFGDAELQRLWVESGIVDTVEHLYRVSILPMPLKTEIIRRVNLDEQDPDFIAKPISRAVLEDMARRAKIAKNADKAAAMPPVGSGPSAGTDGGSSTAPADSQTPGASTAGDNAAHDSITGSLTQAAADGQQSNAPSASGSSDVGGSGYQLPENSRTEILTGANATMDASNPNAPLPSVTVRGSFSSLAKLLKRLEASDSKAAANGQATISLSAPVAQRLANVLAGNVVEPRAVAAAIHRHLTDNS